MLDGHRYTRKTPRRARSFFAAFLVVLGTSGTSAAAPDSSARDAARIFMARGRALRQERNLRGALEQFRLAHAIMHVTTTGLELARAEISVGLLVEAHSTLLELSNLTREGENQILRNARDEAAQLDDELRDRIPSVVVTFTALAAGATASISLDDEPIPHALFQSGFLVNPGTHILVAKMGDVEDRQVFKIAEGERRRFDFNMAPPVAKSAPLATPPIEKARIPPPPSDRRTELLPTPPPPRRNSPMLYVLAGAGAVGIGTGAVLAVIGSQDRNRLQDACAPNCAKESVDRVKSVFTAANVSFAVGGASALAAIVWAVSSASSDDPKGSTPPPASAVTFAVSPWNPANMVELKGTF